MIKNILIVILLVTNGSTLFYIYQHMSPEKKVTVDTNIVEQPPQYFYRIHLIDGGTAEGRGIVKKKHSVDLIDKGKVTMTIDNSNVRQIEKVYFKTGKTKKSSIERLIQKAITEQYFDMHDHFINAIYEIIGNSGAIIVTILGVLLTIMGICLPFFVYKIMRDVNSIKESIDRFTRQR